ncbi:MAG: hypothetical protein UMU75_05765, partial [Halomonas sp.]|nr:hypothetical protein [Halomonas sp.]
MPRPERRSAWPGSRPVAWLGGGVLRACALCLAWLLRDGLPADTRLTAMLPENRQSPLVERADIQLGQGFEDRFVLLLASPDRVADTRALAQALVDAGTRGDARWLAHLAWRDTDLADRDPRQALDAYRYRLLTPA